MAEGLTLDERWELIVRLAGREGEKGEQAETKSKRAETLKMKKKSWQLRRRVKQIVNRTRGLELTKEKLRKRGEAGLSRMNGELGSITTVNNNVAAMSKKTEGNPQQMVVLLHESFQQISDLNGEMNDILQKTYGGDGSIMQVMLRVQCGG
ncbi:hypothetical protein OQA88_11079 [Cercophora sp. LCS_1]